MKIPPSVKIVPAVLNAMYRVDAKPYDTRVSGISTAVIAGRFRAGESMSDIASDYTFESMGFARVFMDVAEALRWELIPRRTRVRLVEREVRKRRRK